MKRLIFCCDGTWSGASSPGATNVLQVAQALAAMDQGPVPQVVYYLEGLGSAKGSLVSSLDKYTAGAFGWGLMQDLREAYISLVFNYQPGDEVFIFGFSRGAFTARSLAGLIRTAGILDVEAIEHLDRAVELYRSRSKGTGVDEPLSNEFRAAYSKRFYTSAHDLDYRKAKGGFDPARCSAFAIEYMGLWDTVGALGIPSMILGAGWFNKRYAFHDTRLSGMVKSARHAVAADETVGVLEPTLWRNIQDLEDRTGNKKRYRQEWFPGDHRSVGGGGHVTDLSAISLEWVLEGAAAQGLDLPKDLLAQIKDQQNLFGPTEGRSQANQGILQQFAKRRPRQPMPDYIQPSEALLARMEQSAYTPTFKRPILKAGSK